MKIIDWELLLLTGLIFLTLVTCTSIIQTRLDRIIELLEDMVKPKREGKSPKMNVLYADGTDCEVEE